MRICLDGKRLVTALPDVSCSRVSGPVPLRVRGEQPVHPTRKIIIRPGSHDEVQVVGHETPREQFEGDSLLRGLDEAGENGVVGKGMENGRPFVAPRDNVRAIAS